MIIDQKFSPTQPMILGFDPGKDKCGVAVMGVDRQLHYHEGIKPPQNAGNRSYRTNYRKLSILF
jgi:hypothetical protein